MRCAAYLMSLKSNKVRFSFARSWPLSMLLQNVSLFISRIFLPRRAFRISVLQILQFLWSYQPGLLPTYFRDRPLSMWSGGNLYRYILRELDFYDMITPEHILDDTRGFRGGSEECDLTNKCYIHDQSACPDANEADSLTIRLKEYSGKETLGQVLTSRRACLASRNSGMPENYENNLQF